MIALNVKNKVNAKNIPDIKQRKSFSCFNPVKKKYMTVQKSNGYIVSKKGLIKEIDGIKE